MKRVIEGKLSEIYNLLINHRVTHYSLHSDSGGKLLFLYEYSKWMRHTDISENFKLCLSDFVENLSDTYTNTFCAGSLGNFWLLKYFHKEEIIDDLLLEHKPEINKLYDEWGKTFVRDKNYDFLHGLLGLVYSGIYCGIIEDTLINHFTNEMLKDLKVDGNIAYFEDWLPEHTKVSVHHEKINFGLSHGLPATIIILLNIKDSNNYIKIAIQLADFIIEYRKTSANISLYDSILYDRKNSNEASRLAWCYGDIGIAVSLWQLGKKINNDNYKSESIRIMKHSCLRKNLEENKIYDACLCHGTSGIAEIFLMFYYETKISEFRIAADYWIMQTLEMAKHKDGLAGYLTYYKNSPTHYIKDFGFLNGVSGIGLSLLSALKCEPSTWNQCLLITS